MHLAYYDESGDDGLAKSSSPLFVLTSCYMHYLNWKRNFELVREFRRDLAESYRIPVKWELHTKHLLLNKKPFRPLSLTSEQRLEVVGLFCELVAQMDLRIVNVVVVKPRVQRPDYEVLDTALKFSIQRIENDLEPQRNPTRRFLIITDQGRVGKMRRTSRRIQAVNYIPSKYGSRPIRRVIRSLIEDPLPKDSKESYFIQICDLVSYVVYLYCLSETAVGSYAKRLRSVVDEGQVEEWMNHLLPSLNTEASATHPYGIVAHPKD